MKRLYFPALCLAFGLLLSSCAESVEPSANQKTQSVKERRELLTKSITERLAAGVTQSDVEDYLVYRLNIPLTDVKDITRYGIDTDTYIFIVNLRQGGWYIFSGDYSTTPVIAYSLEDELLFGQELGRHERFWLQSISELIVNNRKIQTDDTRRNQIIWTQAKKKAATIRDREIDTNDVGIMYVIDTLANDYIPPLMNTIWTQFSPFNRVTPVDSGGNHFPAGCAVVAIGQMLYYMHYTYSFPNDIYSTAYCTDLYTQTPYNFHFSGSSSTTWDQMAVTPNDSTDTYAAVLLAMISQRSGTTYGIDSMGKYAETLSDSIPTVFSHFLIQGVQKRFFDREKVVIELRNDRPVLCSGEETVFVLGEGDVVSSHAFLIDGCRWICVQESEIITDENGEVLSVISNIIRDDLYYIINTGYSSHTFVSENSYYPNNRRIYTGWSL